MLISPTPGNSIWSQAISEGTPHIELVLSNSGSVAPEHFHQLYAASEDPWDFETSTYEAQKYAATLAALPLPCYVNALELGCSIGVLTNMLAPRCKNLLATDLSAPALVRARTRCGSRSNVRFEQCELPNQFPGGQFDLILVSEVGYYFSRADLEILLARIAVSLAPQGHLLLVHFTGETSYPLTAEAVHQFFLTWTKRPWKHLIRQIEEGYLLDLLEKNDSD